MNKRTIKIPKGQMRASFVPESYDAKNNTVELVWTTGSRVKRYSWLEGMYYEELSLDKKHVKLDRLNKGASVLDNHNAWSGLRTILGVVESAKIEEGKRGVAKIRFSKREEIQGIIDDIKDGVIRNISVGYAVNRYEELDEPADDGAPIYRAVDWEPMEISFVTIPADAEAQVRSEMQDSQNAILETREGGTVSGKKVKTKRSSENPDPSMSESAEDSSAEQVESVSETSVEAAPEASTQEAASEAPVESEAPASEEGEQPSENEQPSGDDVRSLEIERQKAIRHAVRSAKLSEAFADTLVEDQNITIDQARERVLAELEKRTSVETVNQRIGVDDMEPKVLRREAAVRAIMNRFDGSKYQMKQGDGEFRQGSLLDLGRYFLHLEGQRDALTLGRIELAKRLMSTSDFPNVLADVANKSLRDSYDGAPNTFLPFVKQKNVADFKTIKSVMLGNGGKLEKVLEHGEYKRTAINENGEEYVVEKFGLIVGRTWELMVNDDLDAFTSIPSKLGVRAREKENEIFWALVIANAAMADGQDFIGLAHANLGTGLIGIEGLGAGRAAMRLQTDLEGELINVLPRYLVVPAALETVADQYTALITPNSAGSANPFGPNGRTSLMPVVEPRLDAADTEAWYLFADKSQVAVGEMALLEGRGPEMFVREGFEVDGAELKIRYAFGMGLVDHRGVYQSDGAAVEEGG